MSKLPFNYDAWRMNTNEEYGIDVIEVENFFTDDDKIAEDFSVAVDELRLEQQRGIFTMCEDSFLDAVEELANEHGLFHTEDDLLTAVAERLWEEKISNYY